MKSNFRSRALSSESVETALLEHRRKVDHVVDRGDEPVLEPKPGEIRLWSDTLVRALFELAQASSIEATQTLGRLAQLAWTSHHGVREACARSRPRLGACVARRLEIRCASGGGCGCARPTASRPEDPDAVVVRLDPGLAFGTGTHPTTALCLQMLDACRWPAAGDRLRLRLRHPRHRRPETRRGPRHGGRSRSAGARSPRATMPRATGSRTGSRSRVSRPASRPASCVLANILAEPLDRAWPVLTAACLPEARSVLVGTLEDPGLRGKGRVRVRF